jgi:hypothetical protein
MVYQIVCLSCGYHRAWPTLVDAHADGHRHHDGHAAPCATLALPATPQPRRDAHKARLLRPKDQ